MKILLCLVFIGCIVSNTRAAIITYGPTKYFQSEDSPWLQGIQENTIYLEDFKDGLLNSPFVASNGFIRGPGDRRSVDADDGIIDGRGENGGTWGIADGFDFNFTFTTNDSGLLPAYVGLVVTRTSRAFETLTVYGASGERLDTWNLDLTPVFEKSSSDFIFDVTEARFVGVYAPEGISRVTLLRANMIDHLQYGYAIPEPVSGMLACAGIGVLVTHRRRR